MDIYIYVYMDIMIYIYICICIFNIDEDEDKIEDGGYIYMYIYNQPYEILMRVISIRYYNANYRTNIHQLYSVLVLSENGVFQPKFFGRIFHGRNDDDPLGF